MEDGPNLATWLLHQGAGAGIALASDARSWSYDELRRRVRTIAAFVRRELGPANRAIVPTIGERSFEMVAAHLGVLYAGAVSAPLPPMSDVALRRVLHETRASLVFAEASQVQRTRALGGATVVDLGAVPVENESEPVATNPSDLAILLYTSGSTGAPRGVMLSTNNVVANTGAILAVRPLTSDDHALLMMPLYYCYGLSVLHTHLRSGGSTTFGSAQFPGAIPAQIARSRATGLLGVPTLFHTLAHRVTLDPSQLGNLRYFMSSGGRLGATTISRLRDALPNVQLYLRYGVTELTSAASCLSPEDVATHSDSIGHGMSGAPLHVLRPDGTPVARDGLERGEIVVRGPSVTLGYFSSASEGESRFRDGAFHTGDVATVDRDGFVVIVGRERELIKSAGHRISPHEVEEVIAQLAGIAEVAVFGVPDDVLGEKIVAAVVLAAGSTLTQEDILAHCASLAISRRPAECRVVAELHRTSNGKVSRAMLRDSYASRAASDTK